MQIEKYLDFIDFNGLYVQRPKSLDLQYFNDFVCAKTKFFGF